MAQEQATDVVYVMRWGEVFRQQSTSARLARRGVSSAGGTACRV
jgi:hypothetical protein